LAWVSFLDLPAATNFPARFYRAVGTESTILLDGDRQSRPGADWKKFTTTQHASPPAVAHGMGGAADARQWRVRQEMSCSPDTHRHISQLLSRFRGRPSTLRRPVCAKSHSLVGINRSEDGVATVVVLIREEKRMKKRLQKLVRVVRKQSGQSLVEYALILALIAVVAIVVLQGLGNKVNNTLSSVNSNLP
jgi:pilus assembly protein Flp/PilA